MNAQKVTNIEGAQPPQPLPGESASAYRAFIFFCDQGPGRTLILAWQNYREHCNTRPDQATPKRMTRCPGQWTRWSTQFHWLERATAYDLEIADRRLARRAEQIDALEEQRFQFERRIQADLEDRCKRLDVTLNKYDLLPVTDVIQERTEIINGRPTRTKSHVKGLRGDHYSAMLRQARDYRRQAILGIGEKVDTVQTPKPHHIFLRSRDQRDRIPKPLAPADAMPEKPPVPPAPAKPAAPSEPKEAGFTITLKPDAEPTEDCYSVRLEPHPPKERF